MEYLTRKKNSLKKWLIALFLIILVATLYAFYFIKSSIAPMDGELPLRNLTGKVSVIRDQFGVPHIKANSSVDAFRALGYVVASERLFQMEMQRRMANGELSEIFGNKTLASDRLFRTLGLRQSMNEMLKKKSDQNKIDPLMWKELEAFYDGVNQFQA
ncbi:MAG: penicillin acylase family protein, partial [Bacteriovorax sp.]